MVSDATARWILLYCSGYTFAPAAGSKRVQLAIGPSAIVLELSFPLVALTRRRKDAFVASLRRWGNNTKTGLDSNDTFLIAALISHLSQLVSRSEDATSSFH